MKITLCGSMYHIEGMLNAKHALGKLGYEIETPDLSETSGYEGLSDTKRTVKKQRLIQQHLDKINTSDAILVFNQEKKGVAGYIGGNSLMEMAFAYEQGIEIFLLHDAHAMGYADEIYGMQPITLNGRIDAIHTYFTSLPRTFVSSKSPIKLRAVSRGIVELGSVRSSCRDQRNPTSPSSHAPSRKRILVQKTDTTS